MTRGKDDVGQVRSIEGAYLGTKPWRLTKSCPPNSPGFFAKGSPERVNVVIGCVDCVPLSGIHVPGRTLLQGCG